MVEPNYDRNGAQAGTGTREKASAALDTAGSAVQDTAGTVKEQAGQVAAEAKAQVRNLAQDVRGRVGAEARTQNDRLADGVRQFADELDAMAGQRGDSPAGKLVTQVSQAGDRGTCGCAQTLETLKEDAKWLKNPTASGTTSN